MVGSMIAALGGGLLLFSVEAGAVEAVLIFGDQDPRVATARAEGLTAVPHLRWQISTIGGDLAPLPDGRSSLSAPQDVVAASSPRLPVELVEARLAAKPSVSLHRSNRGHILLIKVPVTRGEGASIATTYETSYHVKIPAIEQDRSGRVLMRVAGTRTDGEASFSESLSGWFLVYP